MQCKMWICGFCETENPDVVSTCVCCGHEKMVAKPTDNTTKHDSNKENSGDTPTRKRSFLVIIAAVVGIIVLCYFTIHNWKPAACTDPETCTICGKVRAPALGHKWSNATCTEPQRCSVCGAIGNAALGHNWIDATYDQPKTCRR